MLDTVFYFVLNMSIASCFVIAALLLIRQIRPLPRRVIYPLWSVACFRLLMPFALPTSWSLFNFTGGLVKRLITVEAITQGIAPRQESVGLLTMNMIGAAEQYAPVVFKTESLRRVFTTASVIWAIIAAAALLTAAVLYMLTRKELNKAVHIRSNIYRSGMVLSPMLTGVLHPKVILPDSLNPDSAEGRMVLAHEDTHRRRLDNLWRLLCIFAVCLHWYNPFAWAMLKAFLADMEQSCDEAVIKQFGAEDRKAYAGALLRFAQDNRMLISASFGRSGVKVRIIHVLNYKRLTLLGVMSSSLFLLAVVLALITNPQLRG